jgi:hypothetical protein
VGHPSGDSCARSSGILQWVSALHGGLSVVSIAKLQVKHVIGGTWALEGQGQARMDPLRGDLWKWNKPSTG